MKPSFPADRLPRRGALLLAAGTALPGIAPPAPGRAPGYGPLQLGMARGAALRALGPAGLPAPLCAGVEGVMFDWPDPALLPRPVAAMAMFGGAGQRIDELRVSLARPEGGLGQAAWRALVAAEVAELSRRLGQPGVAGAEEEDALGAAAQWRLGPVATLSARWMRRSGASFSEARWRAEQA